MAQRLNHSTQVPSEAEVSLNDVYRFKDYGFLGFRRRLVWHCFVVIESVHVQGKIIRFCPECGYTRRLRSVGRRHCLANHTASQSVKAALLIYTAVNTSDLKYFCYITVLLILCE